jgi:aspartyl-tRNA(Asn)/glutamyl-tRNA(Gln) amidotransferase subunit B
MIWQTVIGLEVHAQLKTASKLFSSSRTAYGAPSNSQTSYLDAGLPGVLPVVNRRAIQMAIQFGLAIDADIHHLSFFERKNYFYPDLPKGYQISQLQRPIIKNGQLDIRIHDNRVKKITIERAHLEEDAGKSLHDMHPTQTGIDLNRAGNPLLEIVTTPCLFSAEEAICYLKTLHQLLLFLDLCDGNMQEGSFRCDVNLSLKPINTETFGTRTELKNLNSFRFIEKAIQYEQFRHQTILESGNQVAQETRFYCPKTNSTQLLRSKENENDYRYFPDPDLLPIPITAADIAHAKASMPECPSTIRQRLQQDNALSSEDIDFLLTSPSLLLFYEKVQRQSHAETRTIVNWLKGTYTAALKEQGLTFEHPPVSADQLADLLDRLTNKLIPASLAKTIFAQLIIKSQPIDVLIVASGYQQPTTPDLIEEIIRTTLANYPQQVTDYRAGKEKLFAFFVGQVMKQTKGQASPEAVNQLLRQHLDDQA